MLGAGAAVGNAAGAAICKAVLPLGPLSGARAGMVGIGASALLGCTAGAGIKALRAGGLEGLRTGA